MGTDELALVEQQFLEGKASAESGLGVDTCPYRSATDVLIPPHEELASRINWMTGWQYARHRDLLQARHSKRAEIVSALGKVVPVEHSYAQLLTSLRQGMWPNPLRYWKTSQALDRLQRDVWKLHEYQFLRALGIQVYLPMHHEDYKTIAVFDVQERMFPGQYSNGWTRELLRRHGDRDGISSTGSLRELVADAGGSEAIHVF